MCIDCGEPIENPCSCLDGSHAWGLTATSTSVTTTSFTMTMSVLGQYSGGWAAVGEHVFIQGYGYFKVTASTTSTITVTEPATPYVGGAAFAANTVDFQAHGTSGNYSIASGTKVTPAGLKGTTGTGSSSIIEEIGHGAYTTTATSYTNLITPEGLVAAALSEDGDTLEIYAKFYFNSTTTTGANVRVLVGGVSVTSFPGGSTEPGLSKAYPYLELHAIVTRASSTTANSRVEIGASGFGLGSYASETVLGPYINYGTYENIGIAGITWANALDVSIQGLVGTITVDTIKLGFYKIENLQQI